MDDCLIVLFLQLHIEGNESKTVDIPTTVHSEARMRNFLHSWVQRRDTELGLVEGSPWWMVKLHTHVSGYLPTLGHSPTVPPKQMSMKNDKKSDIPQVVSSPMKNSKRASTDPMELGEPGPSRRTTSDSSSWHNGHISGKELSRLSVLIIGGSSVPLSCPKHWNNWWYWTIVPGEC